MKLTFNDFLGFFRVIWAALVLLGQALMWLFQAILKLLGLM